MRLSAPNSVRGSTLETLATRFRSLSDQTVILTNAVYP